MKKLFLLILLSVSTLFATNAQTSIKGDCSSECKTPYNVIAYMQYSPDTNLVITWQGSGACGYTVILYNNDGEPYEYTGLGGKAVKKVIPKRNYLPKEGDKIQVEVMAFYRSPVVSYSSDFLTSGQIPITVKKK